MSDYIFSSKKPPTIKDVGVDFVINHKEYGNIPEIYAIEIPLPSQDHLGFFFDSNLEPTILGFLKRQRVWVRTEGPIKKETREEISITETVTQTLAESRSLRALLRLSASASASSGFVTASAEMTAELEATISKQESWGKLSSSTRTVTVEPHRTYVFWNLIEYISFTYAPSHIDQRIRQFENLINANKSVKIPREWTDYLNKLKALKDLEHKGESLIFHYEDAMDDEHALINSIQGF